MYAGFTENNFVEHLKNTKFKCYPGRTNTQGL